MDPALQAWLTPSGLAIVAGAVAWLVRAVVSQDRRIEGLRAGVDSLKGSLERYQTREACGEHHRDLPSKGSMSDAFDQIRALERAAADDRRAMEVALANINGALQRLEDKLDALSGTTPKPLGRQTTNPRFDPSKR